MATSDGSSPLLTAESCLTAVHPDLAVPATRQRSEKATVRLLPRVRHANAIERLGLGGEAARQLLLKRAG
jgi:hypothetical protein